MCNDIDLSQKKTMKNFGKHTSSSVAKFAKHFPEGSGHSSEMDLKKKGVLRPLINQMVYGDNFAKELMTLFAESGHPVFRGTSPSSRGPLKSKGGGKTSIHYNAEPATAELFLRIIVSVNQLSIQEAIAGWCQELAQRVEAHSPQSTETLVA